jgi:glycosyltransferase involved in cell wall biosynthesis
MGISTRLSNLNKAAKKLKHRGFRRVREIVRDYGVSGLMRKVKDKLRYGDMAAYKRVHLITNESYEKNPRNYAKYSIRPSVEFTVLPGSINISRLEIVTADPTGGAELFLDISGPDGTLYLHTKANETSHMGYTVFDFPPVLDVLAPPDYQPRPMRFRVYTEAEGCGVLVNPKKKKHGFAVSGGGSVICRIYARPDAHYVHWLMNNTPSSEQLEAQRAHSFGYEPKFSIIVPLYNTPPALFRAMAGSVLGQTYANWELCLADGSESGGLGEIAEGLGDPRIKYKKLEKNAGISGNSNAALSMATGDYIALLDHDDMLAPQALYSYARLINEDSGYDFIYSDEDKVTEDGARRMDPFFKPDFSPDMLLAFNYITHFTVIKKTLVDSVGWFDSTYDGAQDYDLFLRATEKANRIGHIDDILYHWRIAETSTALSSGTKTYTVEAGHAAIASALERRGAEGAHVELGALPNYFNVVYPIPAQPPKVSIIIPNKDEPGTLRACINSIRQKTTYTDYEIIVVENNSEDPKIFDYYKTIENEPGIRVLEYGGPFNFSAINNFAAARADGELLLFLNNDITVITPGWLEQMAMHALRPEIGVVGAKLLFPDDTVQHGGIILRIGGIAGHSHRCADVDDVGSFARMTLVHNVSAVTAACMMMEKSVFRRGRRFRRNVCGRLQRCG